MKDKQQSLQSWQIWQVILVLLGFPVLYMLNSFLPWTQALFQAEDRAYFFPFWISILILHWSSVLVVIWLLRTRGKSLADIGLRVSPERGLLIVGLLVLVGLGMFFYWQRFVVNSPYMDSAYLEKRS